MSSCAASRARGPGLKRWARSLRFRLTAWYTLVLAAILTAAALVAYQTAAVLVLRETDGYLTIEASRIRSAAFEDPARVDVAEAGEALRAAQAGALRSHVLPGFALFERLSGRVVDTSDGRVVARSANLPADSDLIPAMDVRLRDALRDGKGVSIAFAGPDEERMTRLLTEPVAAGSRVYALQIAVPWDDNEDALLRFGLLLCVCVPVVLVVSGFGSWVVVGRTLRPIGRIVAEAERADIRTLSGPLIPAPEETDSEVGQLVSTLNGMAARMHDAFEAQRRFSADASHELRTPLTVLRGEIEYSLLRPRDAATYQAALADALTAVDELSRIVESLSYLARLDSGEETSGHDRTTVDLARVASAVARDYDAEANRKSIALAVGAAAPAAVRGDEEQIRLMLRNLVDNALKYTRDGGSVRIAVSTVAGGGLSEADVTVTDTGIGLAPDEVERVFDRFWRADRARSSPGSGLGLSIARRIAAAHGGRIDVRSRLGEGASFSIRLPLSA